MYSRATQSTGAATINGRPSRRLANRARKRNAGHTTDRKPAITTHPSQAESSVHQIQWMARSQKANPPTQAPR